MTTATPTENPLAEALPDSLDQIFSLDPRDLTQPKIDLVIQKMREWRINAVRLELEEKRPSGGPRKKLEKQSIAGVDLKKLAEELDL